MAREGRRRCPYREKLVAVTAERFVVIADSTKLVGACTNQFL